MPARNVEEVLAAMADFTREEATIIKEKEDRLNGDIKSIPPCIVSSFRFMVEQLLQRSS